MAHCYEDVKQEAEESLEAIVNGGLDYQRQYVQPQAKNPVVYSPNDVNDPLNAELAADLYIDTNELCKRISYELKMHAIPQALFAERILCRSQGTLSDLLRKPKPWHTLKTGKEPYRRMYNWINQPLEFRLSIMGLYKTEDPDGPSTASGYVNEGIAAPAPAHVGRKTTRRRTNDDGPTSKRQRFMFTDLQKRTLEAIFKETQRPSREMQMTIAEHLGLDLSTVLNFFMNQRRRSKFGHDDGKEEEPDS